MSNYYLSRYLTEKQVFWRCGDRLMRLKLGLHIKLDIYKMILLHTDLLLHTIYFDPLSGTDFNYQSVCGTFKTVLWGLIF